VAAIFGLLAWQRRAHNKRRVRVALHHVDLCNRLATLLLHAHLLRRLLPLRGLRLSHLLCWLLPLCGLGLLHLLHRLLPLHDELPHGGLLHRHLHVLPPLELLCWLLPLCGLGLLHLLHRLLPLHDELPHGGLLHRHLHVLPPMELLLLLLAILEATATTAISATTTAVASIAPAEVLVIVLSPERTTASLVSPVTTGVAACVVWAANRLATATFTTTCTESTLLLRLRSLTPLPRLRSPSLSKLLLEQLILLLELSHQCSRLVRCAPLPWWCTYRINLL